MGDRQGVVAVNGHIVAVWAGNQNGVDNPFDPRDTLNGRSDIIAAQAVYASGPRIVNSTMGPVQSTTVTAGTGTFTFNQTTDTDGTPFADGFVVAFDRPIDPASFTNNAVRVVYRDTTAAGNTMNIALSLLGSRPKLSRSIRLFRRCSKANMKPA